MASAKDLINEYRVTCTRRELAITSLMLPALILPMASCGATPAASGKVSWPDYRRPGDQDDTAALARAFASGRPVHAPAGRGSGVDGRYLVANDATATLPSGATLIGDGIDKTVISRSERSSKPFILHCDSGSPDTKRNITGLRFTDLTFADDVERLGFSEFSYLIMLNGVTDVQFDRVGFRGFRGDGLHFGSSVTSKVERHNSDINVSDCIFDGVNANNRNAISIIDGERLIIQRCRFINVTRRGDGTAGAGDPMKPATGLAQPGAIDVEPNGDAFAIVRDIVIRGNVFSGGGGFAVSLLMLPNNTVSKPQQNFIIENNEVRDRVGAFQAFGFAGNDALNGGAPYNLIVRGNSVDRCDKPFIISGIRKALIVKNDFKDCKGHAELGYRSANADVIVKENLFYRCGGVAPGYALWLREGRNVEVVENQFIDIGLPGGHDGAAIAVVNGTLKSLVIRNNSFKSPNGRMIRAFTIFSGADVDKTSLLIGGNVGIVEGLTLH